MDISGSLEDLQDQNVIVYLLRVFREKYYLKARSMPAVTQTSWTDCMPSSEWVKVNATRGEVQSCSACPKHLAMSQCVLLRADVSGGRALLPDLPFQ